MASLIFALTAPIIGVLLYPLLHDRLKFRRLFDRSMYVIVPVLVLSQVIGHEIAHSGWAPKIILILLGIMTLGIFIPIVIEHMYRQIAPTTEALSIIAGFLGLGLHALLEGASLNAETPTAMLPIMVHRLTVGLMIWWILHPRYGSFIAVIGIAWLLLVTIIGFTLADLVPHELTGSNLFQAFVAGSLLHVIFHESHHRSPHKH
ncbi:MAG: hypothetical protein OXE59_10155 [Bacteroidetes bacterium]|nr:hypothetical protein [Bacteroidota bacterium]